ncbi:MAG: aminoglycoside phosphotransferase family protein [Lautropia sp.]
MKHDLAAAGTPATRSPAAPPDPRLAPLTAWLATLADRFGLAIDTLAPASNDASFRRYFRLRGLRLPGGATTAIVMDAPPPQEDCRPFVHAAEVLGASGASVPVIHAADLAAGFLLLSDFGTTTYLARLDAAGAGAAPQLYGDATAALVRIQAASRAGVFPDYSREVLLRELMLYPDWYLARHKDIVLDDAERQVLLDGFERILANNLAQPAVFVHRDYHCRNLMVLDGPRNPGILDFQDALFGPITYDLVSLLRDAYVRWDEALVLDWSIRYWERARAAGLPVRPQFDDFYRDFEWMGLQRHLKVLGIFARLYHRDGKANYLKDMPLVLDYVLAALRRYSELAPLARLIERIERRQPLAGYTF